ncbi:hypothetical protein LX36DRAFT_310201 [Colletotrichum falcatum]|nr:hypothetical protein LX36DRAFT_310201 [Colletotrichum falcatum]
MSTAHVKTTRLIFSRLPFGPTSPLSEFFSKRLWKPAVLVVASLASGSLAFRTIRIVSISFCHGLPESSLNHSDAVAVTSHVRVRLGLCPPLAPVHLPVLPSTYKCGSEDWWGAHGGAVAQRLDGSTNLPECLEPPGLDP